MKAFNSIYFLILIALVTGCAHTQDNAGSQKPDWVSGKSPKYPDAFYLTGVGEGKNRTAAEDAARAQLAKMLKVEISSEESYITAETESSEKVKFESEAQAKVASSAKELLEGVQIAAVYEEKERFFALAVLDREALGERIDGNMKEAGEAIKLGIQTDEIGNDYTKLSKVLKAIAATEKRDELSAKRKAILPDEPIRDEEWAKEKAMLRQKLEAVAAYLKVTGSDGADEMQAEMMKELNRLGFKSGAKEGAVVIIEAELEFQPFDRGDPKWKFVKGKMKVVVKDSTGSTRGETFVNIQGAGLNENQAFDKALANLKRELLKDFSGFITRAIGGV